MASVKQVEELIRKMGVRIQEEAHIAVDVHYAYGLLRAMTVMAEELDSWLYRPCSEPGCPHRAYRKRGEKGADTLCARHSKSKYYKGKRARELKEKALSPTVRDALHTGQK